MLDQVPLSAYTDEIRTLIQAGRNDEAMSLCRHVLSHYPKHIDTYRQMAEASLEKGDRQAAQELFRRVLSADPENVVAYAGLAIILEREGSRQEALWHLERALELAPANVEIRKELLRVYGEINGKPQARIKLTPGALARLYLQEGLYPQAIQEFQALVSNAPDRVDLRVALAETLWRGGRKRQAAELAESILQVLPYCLKANLILGTVWSEGGDDQGTAHLQRAQALDPGNRVAQELLGSRAPAVPPPMVPSVTGGNVAEPQPALVVPWIEGNWFTDKSDEDDNLETPVAAPPSETGAPAVGLTVDQPPTELEAPTSSGLLGYVTSDAKEKSQAPTPQELEPEIRPTTGSEDSNLPAWLMDQPVIESPLAEIPPTPAEPTPTTETSALPAWLVEASEQKPSEPNADIEAAPPADESYLAPIPNWLSDLQEPEDSAAPVDLSEPTANPSESVKTEGYDASLLAGLLGEIPEPAGVDSRQVVPDVEMPGVLIEEQVETRPTVEPTSASEPPVAIMPLTAQAVEPELPSGETEPASDAPSPAEPMLTSAVPSKQQTQGARHLEQARIWRNAKRLGEALVEYDRVIQTSPELVNEVVRDLESLAPLEDTPLEAHRVLGDALARAGRLSDALEQYRFVLDRVS